MGGAALPAGAHPSKVAAASAAAAASKVAAAANGAAGGKLTVTDDDIIERSNLSRQFLFRNSDVGTSKATAAVRAACAMNPALRAQALQDRVAPETEHVFNPSFWLSLDVVVNALDNVPARLYVDQRCVFYGKPLLESGTLGTKCNSQLVLPHLTENYGASRDAPEKQAPQCAVHNFPHNIDQCLVLAQSEFNGAFDHTPSELLDFLAGGAGWVSGLANAQEPPSAILDKLHGDPRVGCGMAGGCRDLLLPQPCTSWAQCVGWARRKYESYFVSRIRQLLHNFPPDAKTSQGLPFWSPPKRVPRPLPFSPADPLHMRFVIAAAHLRAHTFGIAPPPDSRDPRSVAATLERSPECTVPPFTPFADASIETEEGGGSSGGGGGGGSGGGGGAGEEAAQIEHEVSALLDARAQLPSGFRIFPNAFEKDDDANFHMAFIGSFGNLRARNYGIAEIDPFQAKLKAGRIIPAIATTTAMATGFVCLELYKHLTRAPLVLAGRRNLFANLALPGPMITLSEPVPGERFASGQRWDPETYMHVDEVAVPEGHTLWDKLLVPEARRMRLDDLFAFFASRWRLVVAELLVNGRAIYSEALRFQANTANRGRGLLELIEELDPGAGARGPFYTLSQIVFRTIDGADVKAATVVLQLA